MKKFADKVVFITGGNSGEGRTAALAAAKKGAIVVIADHAGCDDQPTLHELAAIGATCMSVAIDPASAESIKEAIAITVDRFGRIDAAFNNTGDPGQSSCVKYELEQFLEQGGGCLLDLASLTQDR